MPIIPLGPHLMGQRARGCHLVPTLQMRKLSLGCQHALYQFGRAGISHPSGPVLEKGQESPAELSLHLGTVWKAHQVTRTQKSIALPSCRTERKSPSVERRNPCWENWGM